MCSIVSPNAGRFLKFSDHLDEKKGYEFRIVTSKICSNPPDEPMKVDITRMVLSI